jgi:hypothetical protein
MRKKVCQDISAFWRGSAHFFEKKIGGMETIAAEPVAGIVRRERENAKKWGRE